MIKKVLLALIVVVVLVSGCVDNPTCLGDNCTQNNTIENNTINNTVENTSITPTTANTFSNQTEMENYLKGQFKSNENESD